MTVLNYQDLDVWRQGMDLVLLVYCHTKCFPREETYGLASQFRRAAVSVPSNIAEGQGRRSTKEFLHQLSVARGSLNEAQTQVEIARRLDYLGAAAAAELAAAGLNVARLLNGLITALERKL